MKATTAALIRLKTGASHKCDSRALASECVYTSNQE